jgi:diguanylate cyclase (GGDEF)-like protein
MQSEQPSAKPSLEYQSILDDIAAINARAYALRFKQAGPALDILDEAFTLIEDLPQKDPQVNDLLGELHLTAGGLCYGASRYELGISHLHDAYHLFERVGNDDGLARACNLLGLIHQPMGNFGEALEFFLQTRHLTSKGDPTADFNVAVLGNLGFIHLEMDIPDEAEYYLEEALRNAQKNEKNFGLGDILDNLSKLNVRRGNYEKALDYSQQSLAAFTRFEHTRGMADATNSIGHVYAHLGEAEKALEYHQRALKITRELNHRFEEIESLRFIAALHAQRGEQQLALELIETALKNAEEIQTPQLIYRCQKDLAGIYKKAGEFEKALASFENYHTLKQQLFNQDAERRIRIIALMQQLKETKEHAEKLREQNEALEREILMRKDLQDRLEYLAARDPLTDLLNRRAFFHEVAEIASSTSGQSVCLAAILMDIDDFKSINDSHGHLTGDQALRRVAENIQRNIRQGDLACRFGGDEFAIFITARHQGEALDFAERLHRSLNAQPIPIDDRMVQVQASYGVAFHDNNHFDIKFLLEHADQALYQAKHAGKNRVSVYSPDA